MPRLQAVKHGSGASLQAAAAARERPEPEGCHVSDPFLLPVAAFLLSVVICGALPGLDWFAMESDRSHADVGLFAGRYTASAGAGNGSAPAGCEDDDCVTTLSHQELCADDPGAVVCDARFVVLRAFVVGTAVANLGVVVACYQTMVKKDTFVVWSAGGTWALSMFACVMMSEWRALAESESADGDWVAVEFGARAWTFIGIFFAQLFAVLPLAFARERRFTSVRGH